MVAFKVAVNFGYSGFIIFSIFDTSVVFTLMTDTFPGEIPANFLAVSNETSISSSAGLSVLYMPVILTTTIEGLNDPMRVMLLFKPILSFFEASQPIIASAGSYGMCPLRIFPFSRFINFLNITPRTVTGLLLMVVKTKISGLTAST